MQPWNHPGPPVTGLSSPTTQRTPRQLFHGAQFRGNVTQRYLCILIYQGLAGRQFRNALYPHHRHDMTFTSVLVLDPGKRRPRSFQKPLNKPLRLTYLSFYLSHRRWRVFSILALLNAGAMASHIILDAVSYIAHASMWPDLDSPHLRATIPRTSYLVLSIPGLLGYP